MKRWLAVLWAAWGACALFLVVCVVWVAAALVQAARSDRAADNTNPRFDRDTVQTIPCRQAVRFAGLDPAPGMREETCSSRTFQDTFVEGTFRMPRREVSDWLATTTSGGKPSGECLADVCRAGPAPAGAQADNFRVDVDYESDRTARVTLEAYEV